MDMDKFEKLGEKCVGYMLAFCLGFACMNAAQASEFDRQESYYGIKVEMTIGGPEHGDVKVRPFKDNIQVEGYFRGKKDYQPVEGSESFNEKAAIKAFMERIGEVI